MKVIVCVDEKNGMLFCGKRQTRDRNVIAKIQELTQGSTLWIHPFSEKLFEEEKEYMISDEDFLEKAGMDEYCFVENQMLEKVKEKLELLIVINWNRVYPSDRKLDLNLGEMQKIRVEEFAGYSHEKITITYYKRR